MNWLLCIPTEQAYCPRIYLPYFTSLLVLKYYRTERDRTLGFSGMWFCRLSIVFRQYFLPPSTGRVFEKNGRLAVMIRRDLNLQTLPD
jgi:hypothetical protein